MSSSEDPIFRKNNTSLHIGSFKSKSHSFVEFTSSRANSNAGMSSPKMINPKQKEKYIKESSKEIEEEDKNSDLSP